MTGKSGTALVTGGAGYIGSHACKLLAKAGYLPVTYDSLVYGHEWAVKWGPLERGDILDRARLDEVIEKHNPSAVMHFAALAYVGLGRPAWLPLPFPFNTPAIQPIKFFSSILSSFFILGPTLRSRKTTPPIFFSFLVPCKLLIKISIVERILYRIIDLFRL